MKFTKGQEFLAESSRAMVRLGCGRNVINPARDFGPCLFAVVAGFKNNRLNDGLSVWLQPVLRPIVGGLLGGCAYDLFIGKALIQTHAVSESDRAAEIRPINKLPNRVKSWKGPSLCQNIF
jgi:hypothetical protein